MVLSTEWSQVEVIDLVNDGSGLGFGIVGGRSTGVVIKSILPGGLADKDNRLQSGDHILQIGDVNLRGFSAEQVASVLRQTGSQVRMVVARSIEPNSIDFDRYRYRAPIVPTKILADHDELDRQLVQNGYAPFFDAKKEENSPLEEELSIKSDIVSSNGIFDAKEVLRKVKSVDICDNNCNFSHNFYNSNSKQNADDQSPVSASDIILTPIDSEFFEIIPETEKFSVELKKNEFGLGITVAGYVWEREDLNGIFVKNLTEGSEAYNCQSIDINDRIIEVNGRALYDLNNCAAVKILKETAGEVVNLTFERYLRGPKFDRLQEALASNQEEKSPSLKTLSWIPIEAQIEPQNSEIFIEENFKANLEEDLESTIKNKWQNLLGNKANIVVANLTKLKGLGISLEGTVDVECGIELRPRHFIRSILPEGPVGQNGKLSPGDEILEVNGQKLLGVPHVEVVRILRELPNAVRLVCSRKSIDNRVINTSQDREAFEQRNILGGSLKNLLLQPEQRLIKALSDTSIHTSSTVTVTDEPIVMKKEKSRSLEIGRQVATWSDEVDNVELCKTERGLGFSILDYQDPVDPNSTVIVVRSLVPNGPAELDGRITPGDRLMSVDDKLIKNFTLDQAVQVLKGPLPGSRVKLGICKPLPISSRHSSSNS